MHKNDFLPFIFFSYNSFSLSYLELQMIFPCRDMDRDRDFGPATRDPRSATRDPRPATRNPQPATIRQTESLCLCHLYTWQLVFVCVFSFGFLLLFFFFSSESEFVFQAHSTVHPQRRICQFSTLTGYNTNVSKRVRFTDILSTQRLSWCLHNAWSYVITLD